MKTAKTIQQKNKRKNLVLKGFAKEVEIFIFNHETYLAFEVLKKSTGQVLRHQNYGKKEGVVDRDNSKLEFKTSSIGDSILSAIEKAYKYDNLSKYGEIKWKVQEHNLTPEMWIQFETDRMFREMREVV